MTTFMSETYAKNSGINLEHASSLPESEAALQHQAGFEKEDIQPAQIYLFLMCVAGMFEFACLFVAIFLLFLSIYA